MIGNFPTQKNNICFSGMYLLKGKPDDVWKVYDYIKAKNQKSILKYPTDYAVLSSYKKGIIILTDEDINLKNQPEILKKKLKTMTTVLATDIAKFIDTVKLEIINNPKLKYFDGYNGMYEKTATQKGNGMILKFYKNNLKINGSKFCSDKIYSIDFNKEMPLADGLQKLIDLSKEFNKGEKFFLSCHNYNLFRDAVNKSEKLSQLKMKGQNGHGGYNTGIELANNQILKLSTEPNFPEKRESFELPILYKEKIEVCDTNGEFKNVYCYIQPKGKNHKEVTIPKEIVDSVISEMKKQGFEPDEDLNFKQIVIYEGKAYIADTDKCIKDRRLVA